MGRLKYVFLPFVFLAVFAAPLTAPAGLHTSDAAQCLAWAAGAPPDDKCEGCKEKKHRDRGPGDEAALRVYALMTGKSADSLVKACESGKVTIWQLAKREGRLDALKARMLEVQKAGLDAFVKGGIMTEEHRTKILGHMKEELDKK